MGNAGMSDIMSLGNVQAGNVAELLKTPQSLSADPPGGFAAVFQKTTQYSMTASVSQSERKIESMFSEQARDNTRLKPKDATGSENGNDSLDKTGDKTEPGKMKNTDKSKEVKPEDKPEKPLEDNQAEEKIDAEDISQDGEKTDGKSIDMILEELTKAGNKLVDEVSEKMNMDTEDVLKAMEILGLSPIDLMQPENMAALVDEIVVFGENQKVVTDGELFNNLEDLMASAEELTKELADELGLSEEEFNNILNGKPIEKAVNPEQMQFKPLDKGEENVNNNEQVGITEPGDKDNIARMLEKLGNRREDMGSENKEQRSATFLTETQTVKKEMVSDMDGQMNMANTFWNQLLDKVNDSIQNFESLAGLDSPVKNAQDIIDQITEYIKLNIETDTTKLEMHLNPETLGNVNILLSTTKDGNMIAQFTTQNETVREALQSQIAQLQKQFDEQGLKVTEISVSVETRAFEQNLEQNGRENNKENSSNLKKVRRINLGDLSLDIDDEMDDADKLVAQMMALNGNSVDYTA
ncbi:MAG: flagellar hook-length control protein FliK [Butyrivibrio sp.]|nr:flagellar hook-length control protein FliK [Butyrivibrio sp.]